MKKKVIIVTGPTATGKTALGIKIARDFNSEIISADSRQVYKGLDLGTGKDLEDYSTGGKFVPYHLIDIVAPEEEYNLNAFYQDANQKIIEIYNRAKLPLIVGGTALYIDSLLSSYDFLPVPPDYELRENIKSKSTQEIEDYLKTNYPDIYEKVDRKKSRPRLIRALEKAEKYQDCEPVNEKSFYMKSNYDWLILGTFYDRHEVHLRIAKRLDQRIADGMIDEVKSLHENGVSWERLDRFGLEYRYISFYLQGKIGFDEMRDALLAKIRGLARRQDIWFRKMEKKGHKIYWLEEGNYENARLLIEKFLKNETLPEPEIKLSKILYGKKT